MLQTLRERSQKRKKLIAQTVSSNFVVIHRIFFNLHSSYNVNMKKKILPVFKVGGFERR